jgi:hypothetical protein
LSGLVEIVVATTRPNRTSRSRIKVLPIGVFVEADRFPGDTGQRWLGAREKLRPAAVRAYIGAALERERAGNQQQFRAHHFLTSFLPCYVSVEPT